MENENDNNTTNILNGTKYFYKLFQLNQFNEIENLFSSDIRIQNTLSSSLSSSNSSNTSSNSSSSSSSSSKGLTGINNCINKLKEIYNKMLNSKLINNLPEKLTLMRNKREVRFIIQGKVAFMNIIIGFALEWQYGIITGIVIVRDMNINEFFIDNTIEENIPENNTILSENMITTEITENNNENQEIKGETINDEIDLKESEEFQTETSLNNDNNTNNNTHVTNVTDNNNDNKSSRWYRGKYLGFKPPSSSSSSSLNVNSTSTITSSNSQSIMNLPSSTPSLNSSSSFITQQIFSPPYLCPLPPPIPPMLFVGLHSISNLKSKLNRLIERPVNSYVTLKLFDQIYETPIVRASQNPSYDMNKIYYFPLPQNYLQLLSCLNILVKDKHLINEDTLATCEIPLVSLPFEVTNDKFTHLFINLQSNGTKKYGKIYEIMKGNEVNKSNECILILKICLLDVNRWWYLEECKLREENELKQIQIEKELKELNKLNEKQQKLNEKKQKLEKKFMYGIQPDDSEWQDDRLIHSCSRCQQDFSLTNRKHHCRCCGKVVCHTCSSNRHNLVNGESVRICDNCYQIRSKYTSNDSLSNSSLSSNLTNNSTTNISNDNSKARHIKSDQPDSDDEYDNDNDNNNKNDNKIEDESDNEENQQENNLIQSIKEPEESCIIN